MYITTKRGTFIANATKIAFLLAAISFVLTLVGFLGCCYEHNRRDELLAPYCTQVGSWDKRLTAHPALGPSGLFSYRTRGTSEHYEFEDGTIFTFEARITDQLQPQPINDVKAWLYGTDIIEKQGGTAIQEPGRFRLATCYILPLTSTCVFPDGHIVYYEWRTGSVDNETVAEITHSTEIIRACGRLAAISAPSTIGLLVIAIILKSIKVPLQKVSPD